LTDKGPVSVLDRVFEQKMSCVATIEAVCGDEHFSVMCPSVDIRCHGRKERYHG
jgi:hypothetical protein